MSPPLYPLLEQVDPTEKHVLSSLPNGSNTSHSSEKVRERKKEEEEVAGEESGGDEKEGEVEEDMLSGVFDDCLRLHCTCSYVIGFKKQCMLLHYHCYHNVFFHISIISILRTIQIPCDLGL